MLTPELQAQLSPALVTQGSSSLIRPRRMRPCHPLCLPGQEIFLVPSLTRDSARNTRAMPGICHSRAGAHPRGCRVMGSSEICPGPFPTPSGPFPASQDPSPPPQALTQSPSGHCLPPEHGHLHCPGGRAGMGQLC